MALKPIKIKAGTTVRIKRPDGTMETFVAPEDLVLLDEEDFQELEAVDAATRTKRPD